MKEAEELEFYTTLYTPPAGGEAPPEVAAKLRESEMAAFTALERQRG